MDKFFLGMLFLYFPEDKSEYIPALISFSIFFLICVLTFWFFIQYSKKEERKAKKLEKEIKKMDEKKERSHS